MLNMLGQESWDKVVELAGDRGLDLTKGEVEGTATEAHTYLRALHDALGPETVEEAVQKSSVTASMLLVGASFLESVIESVGTVDAKELREAAEDINGPLFDHFTRSVASIATNPGGVLRFGLLVSGFIKETRARGQNALADQLDRIAAKTITGIAEVGKLLLADAPGGPSVPVEVDAEDGAAA